MQPLILQMQMSVDGRVASDDDAPWQVWGWGDDWRWDAALQHDFDATFAGVGAILLSRPMLEQGYLDHWARMAGVLAAHPHGGFARRIGELDKFVLSGVLSDAPAASRWPRTTLLRGPMPEAVRALKRRASGSILCFGGTGFAASLVQAGLVDEYQFYVNPTAVGSGDSIFRGTTPLRLLESTAYACGIVRNRYAHAA